MNRQRYGCAMALVTKQFDVTLHVRNPISLCTAMRPNAMLLLRNAYEGKNFKGSHIVRIREISKMSRCKITGSNNSGEGDIDIVFLADVAIIAEWDIIAGVTLMRTEQFIVGSSEVNREAADRSAASVSVSLVPTPEARTLRVGQKIAVRTVQALHDPMQRMISTVGTLLTCDKDAIVFRLKGSLTVEAATGLMPMVEAIGKELADRAELAERRLVDIIFFEMLLYSYASPPKAVRDSAKNTMVETVGYPAWTGPPTYITASDQIAVLNLLDLIRKAAGGSAAKVDGLWSRPLWIYRSSPTVAHTAVSKSARPEGWAKFIEEDTTVAFQTFLGSILNFLYAVRIMVATFNTKAMIDDHLNVWAAMRAAQIPYQK